MKHEIRGSAHTQRTKPGKNPNPEPIEPIEPIEPFEPPLTYPMNEHISLPRDLQPLADREFDLVVIGGGIHGLAAAYDAAGRGMSVALVEAGDFGGAASFNHQKTAHGGLRSLQSADLARARESIAERRTLARIAPRLLRPMPFLIGTYRTLTRNRLALRAAFRLDRLIGRGRNSGVEPELRLPPPRLISRAAAERLFPGINRQGLTGGAMWYDYQIVEADRLTIGVALGAAARGAVVANHAEAVGALRDGTRVAGARVRDCLSGDTLDIRARLTLNAAGAFAGQVMDWFGATRPLPLVRAMNLMTSRPAGDLALAAPARDGHVLTMTPWRRAALVGTGQSGFLDAAGAAEGPSEAEVAALIEQANQAFPALKLARDSVTLVHHALVPAEADRRGQPILKRHAEIIDHSRHGVDGAITMIGVKYTTARAVAERAVDLAARKLRQPRRPALSASDILPGASIADHEALAIETEHRLRLTLPDRTREHLVALYGARTATIIELAAADRRLAEPLAPDTPAIAAEVSHAIRHEAARRLDDILMRRMSIGAAGWPGEAATSAAARIAARELKWNEATTQAEIDRLRRRYAD
jgi:glycerol-3-phosphate dehydrogenase